MRRNVSNRTWLLLVLGLLVRCLLPVLLPVLTTTPARAAADHGTADDGRRGSFGIILAGGAGHLSPVTEDGAQIFVFADPPEVLKVYADGPAEGILETGDLIIAVDGEAIGSSYTARSLQQPHIGRTYRLTVQRDGRERDLTLTAGAPDARRASENTVEVVTQEEDGSVRVKSYTLNDAGAVIKLTERVTGGGGTQTRAWFGLGLEADVMHVQRSEDGRTFAFFEESPRVYSVDPDSPADRAGIRRGDVLVKVNGRRLDEEAGGELWSIVEPGQETELLLIREGDIYTVEMVGEEHPAWTLKHGDQRLRLIHDPTDPEQGHLRYAGVLGDVDIEVRGVSDVDVFKDDDLVLIQVGETTVRVTVRDDD